MADGQTPQYTLVQQPTTGTNGQTTGQLPIWPGPVVSDYALLPNSYFTTPAGQFYQYNDRRNGNRGGRV